MTVDVHTGEIVDAHLGATEARVLTDRIRGALTVAYDGLIEAWQGRADLALGYESWEAYCSGEFSEGRMVRLDREQRREIVSTMRAARMSTRAIGAGLGVHHDTVADDIKASSVGNPTDERVGVNSLDGRQRPATRPAPATPQPPRVDVVLEVNKALDSASSHTRSLLPVAPTPVGAVYFRAAQANAGAAAEFFARLAAGTGLEAGDPVHTLRQRLIRSQAIDERLTTTEVVYLVTRAWNAWRSGEELLRIMLPKTGLNAKTFPTPR